MLTKTNGPETTVAPIGAAHDSAELSTAMAALWVCDECQVWWGSQSGRQPEARSLLQLAEPNTHLFQWQDYRGWRETTTKAHICSECGREASLPRLSLFG